MTPAARMVLASTLALGGGEPLSPQTTGLLSGVLAVVALWTLSQLWRPPETRWRWGKGGRGRVPVSDFAVIAWAITLFSFSGGMLASSLRNGPVMHTFQVMACVGFVFVAAAGLHDYIRAAVKPPPGPPDPPPATRDEPPDHPDA